jgi:6-pyruvoyltetrahydropterin/6-carboxytetrahydropterin synthase
MNAYIGKSISFDAAHRLPEHKGLCRNVHGHRYVVEVQFGLINSSNRDMILDYGDIKTEILEPLVKEPLDHAYIGFEEDSVTMYLKSLGLKVYLMPYIPTAENIAGHLYCNILEYMQGKKKEYGDVNFMGVKVYETPTSYAFFSGINEGSK